MARGLINIVLLADTAQFTDAFSTATEVANIFSLSLSQMSGVMPQIASLFIDVAVSVAEYSARMEEANIKTLESAAAFQKQADAMKKVTAEEKKAFDAIKDDPRLSTGTRIAVERSERAKRQEERRNAPDTEKAGAEDERTKGARRFGASGLGYLQDLLGGLITGISRAEELGMTENRMDEMRRAAAGRPEAEQERRERHAFEQMRGVMGIHLRAGRDIASSGLFPGFQIGADVAKNLFAGGINRFQTDQAVMAIERARKEESAAGVMPVQAVVRGSAAFDRLSGFTAQSNKKLEDTAKRNLDELKKITAYFAQIGVMKIGG